MYQLAQHIFANPNDKTKVTLVFGNVVCYDISSASIYLGILTMSAG